MSEIIRKSSGKEITSKDIETIKWARKRYPQLSHEEFVKTVCEIIEWTTPAGAPKSTACKKFLKEIEKEGLIELPPIRAKKKSAHKEKRELELTITNEDIIGIVGDFSPISLEIAYVGENLKRWRKYVSEYHMLGDKLVYGSRLQYFIKAGDQELGCVQFSASAWSLSNRDLWIKWDVEDRKQRLHLIVNNSRFLIFPWVKIKNLASTVLSIAIKQIRKDWLREFCYEPVLLETFVDTSHFKGTCYKAANWEYLGETKGRGRNDRNYEYALSPKAIYMYPLKGDFRKYLRGEKMYKVENRDE